MVVSSLVQQIFTLVAVVVGALASYLVTHSHEKVRWRREVQARREERRTAAYADYGRATKAEFQWTMRLAHSRGLPAFGSASDGEHAEVELLRAGHERATEWEEVLLLGSVEAITAARRWHESIWRLQDHARGNADDPAGWSAAIDETERARSAFYEVVRRELGISPAAIPGPSWRLGRQRVAAAPEQADEP